MGERYEVGFDVTPGPDPAPGIVRRGGCLCGAVRYEARGEPVLVGLCHCGDCRRESGSLGLYWADWPPEAVRVEGVVATFGGRSFCPNCGARVVHLGPHETSLLLGTLDQGAAEAAALLREEFPDVPLAADPLESYGGAEGAGFRFMAAVRDHFATENGRTPDPCSEDDIAELISRATQLLDSVASLTTPDQETLRSLAVLR